MEQAAALKRPPMTATALVARLTQVGLVQAMRAVEPWVVELSPEPPGDDA